MFQKYKTLFHDKTRQFKMSVKKNTYQNFLIPYGEVKKKKNQCGLVTSACNTQIIVIIS